MKLKTAILIAALLLAGCHSGTRPLSEPLDINLGNVTVHLITAANQLPTALGLSRIGVSGAAWTRGMQCDIYLYATEDEAGRIFVSEFVQGHELNHLLA